MFTFYAKWPIAAFSLKGMIKTSHGRSFCPDCGGRLFNLHDTDVEIRLGSLDDARPASCFSRFARANSTISPSQILARVLRLPALGDKSC